MSDTVRGSDGKPPSTLFRDETPAGVLEWQLTPTNSRLLRGLLYASWTLSGGFAALCLGALLAAVPYALGLPIGLTALTALAVGATPPLGWLVLSRLESARHGLTFLRLRAPEPSDPTRSVVEHAPTTVLAALACVGALVHAAFLALVVSRELSSFAYILPAAVVYGLLVYFRWWLPTAGGLDESDGRLVLTSFPRDGGGDGGRRWHAALETTHDERLANVTGVRSLADGETAVIVLSASSRPPVLAAVPRPVVERIEAAVR